MSKKLFYQSPILSLTVNPKRAKTNLTLTVFIPEHNTRDIPNTLPYLKRFFPSVLETQCFNEKHLPFREEVKETEVGHLLEHILIDELCLLKLDTGFEYAAFQGKTSWNWEKEQEGIFHIVINIGVADYLLLTKTLEKALSFIELLFKDISYMPDYPVPTTSLWYN